MAIEKVVLQMGVDLDLGIMLIVDGSSFDGTNHLFNH
jgi:hypothetical protein